MSFHEFSRNLMVARKPHSCIWCSQVVPAGDVYYRQRSVYDGAFQNFAWHWDCYFNSMSYFRGEDYGNGVEFASGQERPLTAPFRSMEA